jgi:hypothetical protein
LSKKINYVNGIPQQKDELTKDSYIEENNTWEGQIYLIDEQDYVHGGKDGYDNVPHQQLANRTAFLKTTCETIRKDLTAFQQAVNEQDTANADKFDKIDATEAQLRKDLDDLIKQVGTQDEENQTILTKLKNDVNKLIEDMKTHTHKYAGSDTEGGDANTVKVIKDNVSKILLIGVTGANPNMLKRNDSAFLENNEITANKFHGDLDGASTTANRLTAKAMISFYGDMIASFLFDGSEKNMQIKTSLNTSGVKANTYGTNKSRQISMNETFKVPRFTVNSKGIITHAEDIEITLPEEAVSGTTNATNNDSKLFIIGGEHQLAKEFTYSNKKAYIINGVLYSNDRQVVNIDDKQDIKNKTYEGYTLKEACSHGVDYGIQGTNKSNDLVTSNALYNHKHKYASSQTYGGHADSIVITKNNNDKRYLTLNKGVSGNLEYNDQVCVEGNNLSAPVIHAKDMMHIPGGRIWIDTSVNAIDGSNFNPQTLTQIVQLQTDVNILKDAMNANTGRCRCKMKNGVKCVKGDILSYTKNGMILADNNSLNTATNIVMAYSNSDSGGNVEVVRLETLVTTDKTHDSETVYLGENGKVTFDPPTAPKSVVKSLGFMMNNIFMFNAFEATLINK